MYLANRSVIAGPEHIGLHLLPLFFFQLGDLPPTVRFGHQGACLPPLAQQLLDERTTHTKERGKGLLRPDLTIYCIDYSRPQVQ